MAVRMVLADYGGKDLWKGRVLSLESDLLLGLATNGMISGTVLHCLHWCVLFLQVSVVVQLVLSTKRLLATE